MKMKALLSLILLVIIPCLSLGANPGPSNVSSPDADVGKAVHDPIRIAMDKEYPPQTFLNVDGEPSGIFVDIWRLWSKKTGRKIKFIVSDWPDTLNNLRSGKADIHSGLFYSDSRAEWIGFSQPFYGVGSYLFFKADGGELDFGGDLAGRKIGAIRGSYQEEFLRKTYRQARVVPFKNREKMIRAVLEGKTDLLMAEGPAMTAILGRLGLKGRFNMSPVQFKNVFHAGVLKENAAFLHMIDKGFEAIPSQALAEIEKRWIPDPNEQYFKSVAAKIRLTEKEKDWINHHKPLRVGFPSQFPPLFFEEKGAVKGISPDFLSLISAYSGLQFECVQIPAKDFDDDLRTGRIDMAPGFDIPKRHAYAQNTRSVLNVKMVVVGRQAASLISGLGALRGKKVAVVRGVRVYDKMLEPYPKIERYPTETFKSAVEAVASGKADAVIVGMVMVGHLLHEYPTLKILGLADVPPEPYMFAVRRNLTRAVRIINKAMAAIPKDEKEAIVQKWFKVRIEQKTDWTALLTWVAGLTAAFILILCIFLYWNKRLAREVKERKRAESELQEVFSMSLDMICAADIHTATFLKVNPAFSETLGFSEEELLEKPFFDFVHPEDIDATRSIMENEILSGVKVINFQNRYRCRDGSYRWLSWVSHPDLDKGITYAVARDVTEQKLTEAALMESKRLLDATGRMARVGGWELDAETLEVTWTEETYRIHELPVGYKPPLDEAINFFHPDDQARLSEAIQRALKAGEPYDMELRFITAKGTPLWTRTMCRPEVVDGKTVKLFGTFQDITLRKQAQEEKARLEAQFRQAQKMESVGRLAGGVAHDFNNNLGVILGHVEMLLMEMAPNDPLYSNLREIQESANRAADLTRQLLAFARKQTIAPKVIHLNDTVEGMLKMLRRIMGEDIDLVWRPDTDLWPVKMDPSQIDQILANLCVNARDAISGVGKVTIETENVVIDETYRAEHPEFSPGEYVVVAVSDDGVGMDRATIENVFEPFFTTKALGKGTGLGLSTVYGIVKQNSGFINVYSEPGEGTTFRIYIPRHHSGEVAPGIPDTAAPPRGQGETVLLVEDDSTILSMTKAMLQSLGYRVLTADKPDDAITEVRETPEVIHLLLTDVVMPGMSGKDLAEQLVKIRPDIRTLYMSGYTANVIAHHGVLDEGVHFIEKPFSMKTLGQTIREVLDETRADY